jgi:tetratricopeptide (TPR) repeat protein
MTQQSPFSTKVVLIVLAGTVLGFVVGFALANNINRQEQDKLRAQLAQQGGGAATKPPGANDRPQQGKPQNASGDDDSMPTLTPEQLKNAVAKADESPSDAELQRKVGQALYIYAWQAGNASILPDVARILRRAHDLDPKNFETALMAGDAHFLIARSGGDPKPLIDARRLYESALESKPDDVEARTKYGMTYFYDKPPDAQRAIREYRRALQVDPHNAIPLQNIADALIETGNLDEAEKRLNELQQVNANNQELARLRARLEQKRNAAKEGK